MNMISSSLLIAAGVLSLIDTAAADNPVYLPDTKVLTLPAVESMGRPGFYQDVKVEYAQEGLWRLADGREGVAVEEIETVELIVTGSTPVQVFLKISGTFMSGCPALGQINYRLDGNAFEVAVDYQDNNWLRDPNGVVCLAVAVPFSRTLPLPVYGLDAGDYTYTVNGEHTGSFTLETPNTLE